MRRSLALALLLLATPVGAQPTYKLGVAGYVFPSATLSLEGTKVNRSAVKDDPGFKLQFHILKDGKSLSTHNARASMNLDLPNKQPGVYAAVLELFYPSYKAGKDQKGQFKAISPYVVYQVPSPGAPIKLLERDPALVLECGKGEGKLQEAKVGKGYGFKLIQGKPIDGWPATVAKPHAWIDPKLVRCEISLPAETPGLVRLHLVDGDAVGRKCKVTIQGRPLPSVEGFGGPGKRVELSLSSAETKMGKIEIAIESLDPKTSAVVSTIEFVPAFAN